MVNREDEVRLIAYSIWEEEGHPHGKDCEHWFRAEAIWEEKQKSKVTLVKAKTETKTLSQKTGRVKRRNRI